MKNSIPRRKPEIRETAVIARDDSLLFVNETIVAGAASDQRGFGLCGCLGKVSAPIRTAMEYPEHLLRL